MKEDIALKKLLIVANVSKEHVRKFHIPFILRMKELGWQVDVACRMDEAIPECDHTYDLPCNRNPFDGGILRSVKIVEELLKNNKYDVIHCHTVTGSIVARLAARSFRKKGVKVFYTNHGMHFFKGASVKRWIMGYPMEKILAPLTDVLITINRADYKMASKKLRVCKNIERIHGIGVNLDRFRNMSFSHQDVLEKRRQFGIESSSYVLTYVAEINDNKNQQALLEPFYLTLQAIPEAVLLLVGPEHDNGSLKKAVAKYGLQDKILFLGWRNDIPEILSITDTYVASSKSEGLGLNIIEAMACGLPVVAFKNRGHCEIIRHEKNGFLVEQGDTEEMAKWLIEMRENSAMRSRIVRNAQKGIEKYEVKNVLDELCAIYEKYARK